MSDSPAQLRAKAERWAQQQLAQIHVSERPQACRLIARAYLLQLMHLESPQAAAEAAYALGDEIVGVGR